MDHKPNLQTIRRIMETCKYFTTLGHKLCNKRIYYTSFDNVTKLPCLSQGDKCPRAEFYSLEEAIIQEQEEQKRAEAKRLLAESSLMRGKGGGHKTV